MSLVKAKEAREKRAKAIEEMRTLHTDNPGDKWTDEVEQKYQKILSDEKRYLSEAERYEKMAKFDADEQEKREIDLSQENGDKKEKQTQEKRSKKYQETKVGRKELSTEDRATLKLGESRNNTITGDKTQGGYLVPEGFSNELEKIMKWYGGMMEVAHVMNTATGNDIPWPILDDTANVAIIIGETVTDTNNPLAFSNKVLKSYTYTSQMLPVSMELVQDSYFGVQNIIAEAAGARMGRGTNAHFTTGDGITQPEGVATASSLGLNAASASAITRSELVDLVHKLDRAYRNSPNCRFMFHDTTLSAIKKLSFGSADDRPLWQPSIRVGEPDRLEGFGYTVNNDMQEIGAAAKSILFGDFSKYKIRQVRRPELVVSTEKLIDQRMTVFYVFARYDGKLINTNAVKHLIH